MLPTTTTLFTSSMNMVAVDDHDDDQRAEDGVDDAAQQVGVGDAEQPDQRADDGVAADPDRDRVERDRGEQREERAHAPDRGPRSGRRSETALFVPVNGPNRPIGMRISAPTRTPTHGRGDRLPQRQPEQDREGARG